MSAPGDVAPSELILPWLPEGRTVLLPGRGEIFCRWHRHPDPTAATVLLLHGWTASGDLQFFTAYEALAQHYSFVSVDHRGHGRGMRTVAPFALEDVADDCAALLRTLGIGHVITVGYSMGGPVSLLLARRNPDLVDGVIVQATALEWREKRAERLRWKTSRLVGPALRSWAYPRWVRRALRKLLGPSHEMLRFVPWIEAENRRGDAHALVQAGRALSDYDARDWAAGLNKPSGALITTRDRLVKPRKQRELAKVLRAHVVELDGDHLCSLDQPRAFSVATLALVDQLTGRAASRGAQAAVDEESERAGGAPVAG
jgi:pimeloyl-ACP methyl ester carboxylesterase